MAKINPTLIGANLFGKINGQSISLTRNGSTIKNTSYPRLTATVKQSQQRQKFASLTNSYQFLTPTQKSNWDTESANYDWIDSAGNVRTRNAYQTYNFCNQNLIILDLPILDNPVSYAPIIQAGITKEPSPASQYVIKGADTKSYQAYAIYAMVNNSQGAISLQQRPLLIGVLAYDILSAGVDISDKLRLTFPEVTFQTSVTVKVVAINIDNGNRDLEGETVNGPFNYSGLNLDILSYYPFDGDATDYFGNNNATYTGTTFDTNGIISGQAIFSGIANSYINLGENESLNFTNSSYVGPFTVGFWIKTTQIGYKPYLIRRHANSVVGYEVYQLTYTGTDTIFRTTNGNTGRFRESQVFTDYNDGEFHFFVGVYQNDKWPKLYVDGVQVGTPFQPTVYVGCNSFLYPMLLGRFALNSPLYYTGTMSELFFINGEIDETTVNKIYNANLSGQTIIDIN